MEAALQLVLGKLAQQIQNETTLVFNFKQDFKWLKMRLSMLTAALQYADENGAHLNAAEQEWIEEVRDTLWDAQDILDLCSVHRLISGVGDTSYPRRIIFRYKMGRKIREIKGRMRSIMETANDLKLIRDLASCETETSAGAVQRDGKWKKASMMEDVSLAVSIHSKVQDLVERLEDPAVHVLAVVGMGGIGKTFLLQHLYNKVKHMFDDSVWLSVSQSYSVEQLQRDLASKLNLKDFASSKVSCTAAAEIIHGRLEGKKSLVVLDDVWRATEEEDIVRSLGIPIAVNNRCKVIVSSRNKEVFSHRHPLIYKMPFLSEEDSWKLFCAHAFSSSHENSPPAQLEMFAHEIAKECKRLPLAIKTVASSLATATTSREWELKLDQLKKVGLVNPHDPILQILKLSYYWLPSFLKPCFVYLSFFPEDKVISCEYLVNLWIAEGFIPQTEDQVGMAWDYLRQLANLCLVDVLESGRQLDKYCRVHDLVLELTVNISRENKSAFSEEEASIKGKKSSCRRILLAKKDIDGKAITESNLCCPEVVRALSLSQNPISDNILPHILSNARVLRVLDLGHTHISTLPESVGDLKLLRILNLYNTQLQQVPQCVRKLKSLSFLDVSHCQYLDRLPLWIGELVSLQHLNIKGTEIRSYIPKGVSKLMSLRTLRSVCLELSVENDEFLRCEDFGNMTSLQELSIVVRNGVEMRRLARGALDRLVKMRTLQLMYKEELARIPLPETIKAMKDLQRLQLDNLAVPVWICGFENIRVLHFRRCDCSDLYPALGTMSNLTVLILQADENCRELPKAFGKAGGFPHLRVFRISGFRALEELPEMEDGAMASLETLWVVDCPSLSNVPPGFQGLKRLREFSFVNSGTDEYRLRLKEEWSTVEANKQNLTVDIF